jgi:multisubunit Na+/H+ antiporter MnhB subunit
MDRLWTFLKGLSVVLGVVTGSVAVAAFLAHRASSVESSLTDATATIGWVAILVTLAMIVLYFVLTLIFEFFDEGLVGLIALLVSAGVAYLVYRYDPLRLFSRPDIDKPSKDVLEPIGWGVIGYLALQATFWLIVLVAHLTHVHKCPGCAATLPRKARFCPACGHAVPVPDATPSPSGDALQQ